MPCSLAVFPREAPGSKASPDRAPVYRPRKPEASPLWQLVTHHASTFLDVYDDRYAARYGPLRAVVPRALEGFQRCGVLAWGFARVRCPDCRHEYLLAFSCKQRCLCPSCHAKRQAAFGAFVTEEILEAVPHRHVVISLPRRLRPFFRRRKRLTRLARLAYETIRDLLQAAAGTSTAVPGAVACLQSAGNLLDWHPHVHLLVSWGLFRQDGSFLPVEATPDPETVARLFRHRVLRMLLAEGAIEESVVRSLLAWPHTGFGTHVSRAIPVDEQTPGVVARYMARPPITPERMLGDADKQQVIYRSDAIHPRHQANFRVFDPLDFLAEVSAHIPDTHEKTTSLPSSNAPQLSGRSWSISDSLPARPASARRPLRRTGRWPTSPASGPPNRSMTCLCVAPVCVAGATGRRRQATFRSLMLLIR
jgi:transposase-like protein